MLKFITIYLLSVIYLLTMKWLVMLSCLVCMRISLHNIIIVQCCIHQEVGRSMLKILRLDKWHLMEGNIFNAEKLFCCCVVSIWMIASIRLYNLTAWWCNVSFLTLYGCMRHDWNKRINQSFCASVIEMRRLMMCMWLDIDNWTAYPCST